MGQSLSLQELQRRLGPADVQQIQLLLRVPPAERVRTMLKVQSLIINTWRARLRATHPELNDLELCQLVFQRLKQNG